MEISYVVMAATMALLLLVAARWRRSRRVVLHSGLPSQSATQRKPRLDSKIAAQLNTQLKHLTSRISLLAAEGYGLHSSATDSLSDSHAAAPFGPLAEAWIDFVCAVEPQDDLWMVKIPRGETIASLGTPLTTDAHGFAIVRQGRVVNEFFYQRH
jgi:hypothetical protein